jgi:hypothetical protein
MLWLLVYGCVWILLFLWYAIGFWKPDSLSWSWALTGTWRDYHIAAIGGWLGRLEVLGAMTMAFAALAVVVCAWLYLPFVHRTGPVWPAYMRAVRAGALVLSPLTVATLLCGAAFIVNGHDRYQRGVGWGSRSVLDVDPKILLFFGISIALCVLAGWLQHALAGVADADAGPVLPPRCEECGYDLTHQPADGRCPECGATVEASLDAERSRPGSAWAQRKTTASWRATSHEVLVRPRAFYRRLQLRTPLAVEAGFALRHYVWIGGGAALWAGTLAAVLSWQEGPPPVHEIVDVALMFCALIHSGVFGCWLGQRAIAALVVTWWLARGALPDTGWAAKVIAYETTFLWVFCTFWGLLLGSYMLVGPWLSNWIAPSVSPLSFPLFFILGMPVEAWAVVVGTLALGAVWLWRYHVAYRAIRWSNF